MSEMACYIYKSRKKPDTYLFLPERDKFDELPEVLLVTFGEAEFVMELALTPERKLVRESASVVMDNIRRQGFHIQLPPGKDQTPGVVLN